MHMDKIKTSFYGLVFIFFFFFSSRRRHTRCLSDWSSDVCSSDLRSGWFERDAEGAGLRLNWAGHGERLDEGVGIPGLSGLSAGDPRRAPAAQVVDQAQAGESQHALCG